MKADSGFIKRCALEEGFDLVGIAGAKPLDVEAEHLREWLGRGYNASMSWMARSPGKRTDPRLVLENAGSVISLARNYYVPVAHAPGTAKISRYAWGDDYHLVIDSMLRGLVSRLASEYPEGKFTYYCDTGPVMDKAWAERSGIGWIGKHTNVINTQIGSWLFLAEVITDLECDYDTPAPDHCGECRECIDACPTGAIVEPYVLDANRCISFLTIENRDGSIPHELATKLENWVFGCDICQDVCPWNRKFQTQTTEDRFLPREENLNLKAEDIHLMSEDEFSQRYKKSPVRRAKYSGFQRNAKAILDGS